MDVDERLVNTQEDYSLQNEVQESRNG